jgi:hypothetical protein
MKEKLLEAFGNMGFMLKEVENMGYSFSYEETNLLFMYNENDEDFLNIAIPGIYEIEEGKMLQVCALLEKINSTLKYVKAYILGGSVWLFYERELFGDEEDLMSIISRMILNLEAGLAFSRKAIVEIEKGIEDESSNEIEDVTETKDDND